MSIDLGSVGGRTFDKGYAGQVADGGLVNRTSATVEGTNGAPWGAVACKGSASGTARPFDDTYTQIIGVFEKNPMHPLQAGVAAYAEKDAASIIEEGPVFVLAAEDGRDKDQVIILNPSPADATTGTFGFSKGGAANGTTRRAFPGQATLEGDVVAGQICKIRLRASVSPRTTT